MAHPVVRRFLPVVALALAVAPLRVDAQQRPLADRVAGNWQGALQAGPSALRLRLSLTPEASGAFAALLTSIDQGNTALAGQGNVVGDSIVVEIPTAHVHYAAVLAASGDSLRGSFRQGDSSFPLVMTRVAATEATAASGPRRPQTPQPPFPYRTADVSVASVPGVRLAGTVVLPQGAGPFPAVVFVTGSGPQDRDETLLGHKPFLVVADYLARHGIASLRYDDRGTAASTGDFRRATSADFADDAEAAVRFLRTYPGIEAAHVGILGHSEGGLIGPMVAARNRDVAFVVMMAGPGVRGDSILALQGRLVQEVSGVPHDVAMRGAAANARLFAAIADARDSVDADARAHVVMRSLVDSLPAEQRAAASTQLEGALRGVMSPWMRYFFSYDPATSLRHVTVPVLALNGTLDLQVPYRENLAAIDASLKAAGNRDYRTVALPGLNHLFQPTTTGNPAEYEKIETTVSPEALDIMANWILQHTTPRR